MTVTTTIASQTFQGNGVATAFPCQFEIILNTDINVYFVNPTTGVQTLAALNSDYTVAGAGASSGFTVNTTVPVPTGTNLYVVRALPLTQPVDLTNQGAFFPNLHEAAFDRLCMQLQQIANYSEGLNVTMPPGLVPQPSTLFPIPLAGSLIGWNATGTALVNVGASGIGAGSIADINIANNAAIQSTKTSFTNNGTGATARSVQAKLADTLCVKDFGATGNGVTDDTAAIQAALAQAASAGAPRRVYFPMGTYLVSSGFVIAHPIRLVGEGAGGAVFGNFPAENGTHIKYTGTAGATMFTFSNVNFGNSGIEGLWIDCNNLAANGVLIDGCMGARFACVKIENFTFYGMKLTGTTSTCSWNHFENLAFNTGTQTSGTKAALWLSGVTGGSNACHCTFVNTMINTSGSFHGIYLGGCDNINFLMSYIYRAPGGTGYGVYCDFSENGSTSSFPVSNVFTHLEAMAGYYEAPATPARNITSPPTAVIYGYQTDNGEPFPVLPDGAPLPYITNYGSAYNFPRVAMQITQTSGTQLTPRFFDTVLLNYGAATSVTDILGNYPLGAKVRVYQNFGAAAVTLVNSGGTAGTMLFTKGGTNVVLANNNTVEFIKVSSGWNEIGRNF